MTDNETNGQPSHSDMIKLLARHVEAGGAAVKTEHRMPNNKIADVAYASPFGSIHVIEVKTILRPHLIAEALQKYGNHAHYVWIAAPVGDPLLHPTLPGLWRFCSDEEHVGLIEVAWEGPRVISQARLLNGPPINAKLTLDRLREGIAPGELALWP